MNREHFLESVLALQSQGKSIRAIAAELGVNRGRVARALKANASQSLTPTASFIGRQQELGTLTTALDEALAGRGQIVMLAGEPGIGKTRTSQEIASIAERRGAQVLWGRCYEGQGAPPYWPWIQIIRSYVTERDAQTVRREMGKTASVIAEIVPDVRERLPNIGPASPMDDYESARFRLFDSISTFLKIASRARPIVLILEDLHWADKPSLMLLEFVGRELGNSQMMIVGNYRDMELNPRHPLSLTLGELTREGLFDRLLLHGLQKHDVKRFIEAAAGIDPPSGLVEVVYTQTEGKAVGAARPDTPTHDTDRRRTMYFEGTLCIDPSQITEIAVKKPTKAFAKMLHVMTLGLSSEKEERETFTAVAILQSLNKVLRGAGITNIVRLAKNDEDMYLDREGKTDDLREAMQTFSQMGTPGTNRVFDTLTLVLEDRDDELKYLIEVVVKRVHFVGEFPIRIVVNGLLVDFAADDSVTREQLLERLEPHFTSQRSYDELLERKKKHFESYLDRLESEFRKHMGVDDILRDASTRIVRPRKVARERPEVEVAADDHGPFFDDYYGIGDYYLYSWMWSELCYQHDVHCCDCMLVDEGGHGICSIGERGFDAASSNTMNPDQEFEAPAEADVEFFAGSEYSDTIADSGVGETVTGWTDSVSSDFGDSGGGSSCGSSCGGGCGGE